MIKKIPVFNLTETEDLNRLTQHVREAYNQATIADPGTADENDDVMPPPVDVASIQISAFPDLIGIDLAVYRQIQAALRSGKRHLMFYGPPGTGKTEIARNLAGVLHPKWRLITGSADWTSQDVIGGYQPVGDGKIEFIPGVLLREFDRPLIIDELNRCDIDKVIGPLFTMLSGQASTLPYRVDVSDKNSEQYVVLPQAKPGAAPHEFAPSASWRIIGTINSIDKASLYQMSYALTRRFGWIFVDAPADLTGFLIQYLKRAKMLKSEPNGNVPPLVGIWQAINSIRAIGAAPIIDTIKTASSVDEDLDFLLPATPKAQTALLDGFYMYLLPMLDGILRQDAENISSACIDALGLPLESQQAIEFNVRVVSMAV